MDFTITDKREIALSHTFKTLVPNYLRKVNKDDFDFAYNPKSGISVANATQLNMILHVLGLYKLNANIAYIDDYGKTHVYEDILDPVLINLAHRILAQNNVNNIAQLPITDVGMLDGQTPNFGIWDKQPRAMNMLERFYQLDTSDDELPELSKKRMKLAFFTSLLTHVAILNNRRNITYSLIPIILSTDKNIGKSSFLNRLLNAVPNKNVAESDIKTLFDAQQRGRLYYINHAVVLDEINPYDIVRNVSQMKNLATQTEYVYDQKYQVARSQKRQTAIFATTNDPKDKFAIHETDRRLQFIKVRGLPVHERTDFDDFDFKQVWAELNYYVQRLEDDQLKSLTQWSEDLTEQNVAEFDEEFKAWLYQQTNYIFDDDKHVSQAKKEKLFSSNPSGYFISPDFYLYQLQNELVTKENIRKRLLDSLGVKFSVIGENIEFKELIFLRRLTSFIASQVQGETKDFSKKRMQINGKRMYGYFVKDKPRLLNEDETIAKTAIEERLNKVNTYLNSCMTAKTQLEKRLVLTPTDDDKLIIQHENVVEYLTPVSLPENLVNGFHYVGDYCYEEQTYYRYIGLVSHTNAVLLSNNTMPSVGLDTSYENTVVSIDKSYIFVGESMPLTQVEYDKLNINLLIENTIVPFISKTLSRQLSTGYKNSEKQYHVEF